MNPAALIDRIDWPATGLLLAGLLAVCFLLIRLNSGRHQATGLGAASSAGDADDYRMRELRELRLTMREELDALRAEVAALRQEMGGIKAARNVAPQYGEAMTLAGQGASAQDIAERCGISVAEAELVRALGQKSRRT
jgi:hypothetical protein